MKAAPQIGHQPLDGAAVTRLIAATVIATVACIRACVGLDAFPGWSADPTSFETPLLGLGPAASLVLNGVLLVAAASAVACSRRPPRTRAVAAAAFALGAGAVAFHAHAGRPNALEHLLTGADWLSAVSAGLGAWALGGDRRAVRVLWGSLAGVAALLAIKSAVQVFVEHAQLVEMFNADREAVLAAQGWTEGSSMARAFERRLLQPEATGWIGLSNPFATLVGALCLMLVGLASAARSVEQPAARKALVAIATFGAAGALFATLLTRSKGGLVALAIGGAVFTIGILAPRVGLLVRLAPRAAQRLGGAAVVAIGAASLAAIAARGAIGERLGELSLLFRWFYMQGAARIFAANPIRGVGPAGFRDAYMLAKPPLSPEEVSSPHSIISDYAATLGIFGLAWVGLFAWLAWNSGRGLLPQQESAERFPASDSPLIRAEYRCAFACAAAVAIIGAWSEQAGTTPEAMLVRAIGLALGVAISGAALRILASAEESQPARRAIGVTCAAVGTLLAAHSQIETTPVWPGAAALFFALLGACAAWNGPSLDAAVAAPTTAPARAWLHTLTSLPVAAAAVYVLIQAPRVWSWESLLRQGVAELAPTVRYITAERAAGQSPAPHAALEAAWAALAADGVVPRAYPGPRDAQRLVFDAHVHAVARALTLLDQAIALEPSHTATMRAASRTAMQLAAGALQAGDTDGSLRILTRAEETARSAAAAAPASSVNWNWLGTMLIAQAEQFVPAGVDPRQKVDSAIVAFERSSVLDPCGVTAPPMLADALARAGRAQEAKSWARRAISLDDNLRLDPVKRMPEAQRRRMVELADLPAPSTPPPP